jgi:hypothetical protein
MPVPAPATRLPDSAMLVAANNSYILRHDRAVFTRAHQAIHRLLPG